MEEHEEQARRQQKQMGVFVEWGVCEREELEGQSETWETQCYTCLGMKENGGSGLLNVLLGSKRRSTSREVWEDS